MTLHIIKLSVGSVDVQDHADWQAQRLAETGRVWHTTRMAPRRGAEVLDGGSIYWVVRGLVSMRQRIIGLEPFDDDEGVSRCRFVLDPALVLVRPVPRRPFQGWRYLKPQDAPPDLSQTAGASDMPAAMRAELAELGLL